MFPKAQTQLFLFLHHLSPTDIQLITQNLQNYIDEETNSILVLFNFENVNVVGFNSNWSISNDSFYSAEVFNYTINNGFGQFGSILANKTFAKNTTNYITKDIQNAFESTYAIVYNWKNNLDWNNNFDAWYNLNKSYLNQYLQKFMTEFFGL